MWSTKFVKYMNQRLHDHLPRAAKIPSCKKTPGAQKATSCQGDITDAVSFKLVGCRQRIINVLKVDRLFLKAQIWFKYME